MHLRQLKGCLKFLKFLKKVLTKERMSCIVLLVAEVSDNIRNARVAQLVERDLAKVEAAGSSPVSRFCYMQKRYPFGYLFLHIISPTGLNSIQGMLFEVSEDLKSSSVGAGHWSAGPIASPLRSGRFKADVHRTS